MGTFDEEVQTELEKRKASKPLAGDSNPVEATPVAETPAVAEPPKTDFDSEVNAELEKRKVGREQPQEPKEPDYISKFREYGPSKDDEDVKTSLDLLSAEERKDLLKTHPWSYTKMTPKQQEEQFQLSRKSHPISGGEIVEGLGSILGTGVDLVKKAGELGYDTANVNVFAPIKQAIENKSYFEVKGHNDIVQKAQDKLDQDARNLSSSVPAGIINTTRTVQKIFGGKDLNGISNPIQRAVTTAAPVIGQQLGIPIGVTQSVVGTPMPQQAGEGINPWGMVPNTGIVPFDLVTKLAESTYNKNTGSFAAIDRLNESLGLSNEQQSREHDNIRRLYDAEIGAEDWKASRGEKKLSPWSQVAFSDVGQQAILLREKSMLPSAQFIADHDGISIQEADAKRDQLAEQNAEKATLELTKQWNKEYDPSMEFLGSLFIGDAGFGEAGLALGAGKLAVPLIQKAKTLGMSDREISAYYDAMQKLEKAKEIARQKKMSQPSWWGQSAGYVEQKQKDLTAAGQSLFEKLPAPVQAAAPIAGKVLAKVGLGGVGGGVGALLDPENPTAGLLGGLSLTTALGITPSVLRSVDAARRAIGAGEGKLFTKVAKSEESSLPARVIFNKATGPVIDYLAENGITLAKSGVNLGALSAVTSTLNSDDPEEFNKAVAEGFGMGMGFHLAHGVAGKIHGKDPAQEIKERKKRDVEIYEAVKTASPATQGVLEEVSNYQTAIDRVDALVAKSERNLSEAIAKEDPKWTQMATDALKNARALQGEVLRANVQTRNEYGRSFLSTYTDMNRLANGARRAGQPNVSIEILTPEQIVDLHVSENSRQGMTPDELLAVRSQGEQYARERGFFDRAKSRAVVNAAHILARTTLFGESSSDALRHETAHALDEIPEFKKLNEKTDQMLFTNEEKDLQGNVLKKTDGIYDDNALVEMYLKNYIGDRNQQEKIRFSEQLGLWNRDTNSLNIPAVVKYMKSEIRAELTAGTLRAGLGKLMGAEATIANWVAMRQKQNFLARAIQSVTGLGAKPFSSQLLGIEYTPEVIAANREAVKALSDFDGRFSLNPEGVSGREMSEKDIRTNPVLRKRYGLSGGEFQTELKGVIRDADGKIVGTPVSIANPLASEGNWSFDSEGNRKQTRGYGQVPDEFQGTQIPAGGSLEVYRDFVYEPDGKTPVRTKASDLAKLEKDRGDIIRQALTDAIYDDSTTRLTPFSADGLSWSGVMSKSQIQAIKDIPESILPLVLKERIFSFNDAMARGDGSTFDIDYAPRLGSGKAYKGRKSDIYHIIPIGFGFSKAGNFYLRTLSLNAAFRKLKARAKLMKGWLEPWDNNPSLFMKELQDYLNNTYEKRDGWLGLDPEHPTEKTRLAEVKFGRFLDFMNMIGAETPPNPQRAATPVDPSARKSKKSKLGAEEDNQGIDNLWRSHRLDAIVDIADTTEQTGRYRMDLDRVYKALMPAEQPAPAPAQEERKPTAIDLGITAAHSKENVPFGATYVAPQAQAQAPKTGISFMPASAEIREKGSKQQLEFFDRVLENSGIKDKPNTMAALDKFIHNYVQEKYYTEEGKPLTSLFPQVDPLKIRNYYQKAVRDATPEQAAEFPPDWLRIRNMSQAQFDASFGQDRVDQITQFRVNALAKSANYLLGEMKEYSGLDDTIDYIHVLKEDGKTKEADELINKLEEKYGKPYIEIMGGTIGSYNPAEVAAILNASAKFRVNTTTNENGELVPVIQNISNGNEAVPNEISGETASKIAEYMRMGMASKDAYVKGVYDNIAARAKKRGVFTGWKKYDQSSDMGDAETLNADCAGTGWCTGGSVGTANSHLTGGDFYLYFDKGDPQLAIRTIDGKIAEVRGTEPATQRITKPEYDAEAERFILSKEGPEGGADYLHDRNFRKMAVEVMKTGKLPEDAYKYYDQYGAFMAPRPKQIDYGNGFEKEYTDVFNQYEFTNDEIFNDSTKTLNTSFRYTEEGEYNKFIKHIKGDIIGTTGTLRSVAEYPVDMPSLESVNGGIILNSAKTLILPKLKSVDYIYARNAVDVDIRNLETCNSIQLDQSGSLIAPKLQEVPRLIHADEAIEIDLRNLKKARDIRFDQLMDKAKSVNLSSLKECRKIYVNVGYNGSLNLPKLEKGGTIYIQTNSSAYNGEGSVYLPKLKRADTIYIRSSRIEIPNFDIFADNASIPSAVSASEVKSLVSNKEVAYQMVWSGKYSFVSDATFTDSRTGKTYKIQPKSSQDFWGAMNTIRLDERNHPHTEQKSEDVQNAENVIKPYEIDTQSSRDSAQGIQFMPSRDGEERIKEATYTNPRTGETWHGLTHLAANTNAPQEATDRESPAYGFYTTKGRIVDRNEAFQIAQAAGQLKEPTTEEEKFHADRGVLHSGMYEPIQRISSAGTSIRQVPAVFKAIKWNEGTLNADIGGGKYDDFTNALQTQGVENVIYDPYNRSAEHNQTAMDRIAGNADTATISNVLNVIAEPAARDQVIRQAADAIKPDGEAYFSVYDGDRSGKGKETPRGYQLNKKLADYVEEIEKHFGSVTKKGNILIAKEPIKAGASDISFMPAAKLDEAHAAAIESGDTEEAQRLVDEAARKAGYDITANHTTSSKEFSVFNRRYRTKLGIPSLVDETINWFRSGDYTGNISNTFNTYLKLKNPKTYNGSITDGYGWDSFSDDVRSTAKDNDPETFVNKIKTEGHDGVQFIDQKTGEPQVFGVFDPEQIKSRDAATYDDQGNLIPLSQRFNPANNDIRFMPYSPELPKTEDGKVDWDGFKTKTQEIAKPLAGLSFMPSGKQQDIEMKPSDDGRTIVYNHDPKTTIKPPTKSIKTLIGEIVGMLEADRHNTLGDNMGGPMHPFLLSNQVIARLMDGRGFKPVWANMNSAFVTRAKNIIKNTTSGRALIQLMKEEAHISNRKFVNDVMSELDKKKSSMPKDIVDSLHVILELGARNPATKLKEVTKAQKAFKDGDISQRELNKVIKDNQEAIDKYGPMVAFLAKLGSIKSMATRGNIDAFNKAYSDHIKSYQKQDWYKQIAEKYKDTKFADEAARFTFNQRGAAMKRLRGIAHAPDIGKMLEESMDFKGGKNLDLVASVQLSKDPDAFAIYTGSDPKQEAKMSENERYLRDQFIKNPKFRKHPSYDWMMLGPEAADNFILEKPVDPLVLFPDYAKSHPKASVRNGSKETIVGTMKKSKIPLKISKKQK